MAFRAKVKKMRKVGVVDVGKHSEELAVNLLCDSRKVRLEITTKFDWKVLPILDRLLNPGHDIVDIRRSW